MCEEVAEAPSPYCSVLGFILTDTSFSALGAMSEGLSDAKGSGDHATTVSAVAATSSSVRGPL